MALIRRWLFLIALGVVGAWLVRHFLVNTVSVATGSMEPTLYVDTHYLVLRCAYWSHGPQRGDIISFRSPIEPQLTLIKRVIAIGGDQIELKEKNVILNGQQLSEPFAIHKRAGERLAGDSIGPLTVPAHQLFVLGDNRDVSEDSSYWHDPSTHEPIYFIDERDVYGRLLQVQ